MPQTVFLRSAVQDSRESFQSRSHHLGRYVPPPSFGAHHLHPPLSHFGTPRLNHRPQPVPPSASGRRHSFYHEKPASLPCVCQSYRTKRDSCIGYVERAELWLSGYMIWFNLYFHLKASYCRVGFGLRSKSGSSSPLAPKSRTSSAESKWLRLRGGYE